MNNDEAKFKLGAYRPNGADAEDALMREALAQAERDPELARWFAAERAHDAAVGEKLREIVPPTGLREAILAGAGAGGAGRRTFWRSSWVMPMAAGLSLVLAGWWAASEWGRSGPANPAGGPALASPLSAAEIALVALRDMAGNYQPGTLAADMGALGTWLETAERPFARGLPVSVDDLALRGCKAIKVGGREVYQIYFNRDGWYHLYVARRGDFEPASACPNPTLMERGGLATASWACSRYVYVVSTEMGLDALKRLL